MQRDAAESRRKILLDQIRTAIVDRNNPLAQRLTVDFNQSDIVTKYPSLRIKGSDLSWSKINRKFNDRIREQKEEKIYRP